MAGCARVGTSGWVYPDWRGTVYPQGLAATRWFEHYASLFDTVELNSTFYRLPSPATADRWGAQAPAGFAYAVKLHRFATHRRKLREPERWLADHVERASRLGSHLGPTLVQLPPHWHRDVARLDAFLAASREQAPAWWRWAVEVRDPTWLHDDVLATLERHGAALCLHDLLASHPWVLTADWTYVRFHGPDAGRQPYQGEYGGRRLWRVADRLGDWLARGIDVHAYFNNDVGGAAVADARWLRERLSSGSHRPRRRDEARRR